MMKRLALVAPLLSCCRVLAVPTGADEALTVTCVASGGGSVDAASKTVARGGTVSFTATAEAGKELYAWFGTPPDCQSRLKTTVVISNVTESLSLVARFGTPYYVEASDAAQDADGYGLTPDRPFRTPAYAAAQAPDYAICHVKGLHKPVSTISLNRPIRLAGEGVGATVLSGAAIDGSTKMALLDHEEAILDGMTVVDFKFTLSKNDNGRYGVLAEVVRGLLSDVRVDRCSYKGYKNHGLVANRGGVVSAVEIGNCTGDGFYANKGLSFCQTGGYTVGCRFHDCSPVAPDGNVHLAGGTMDRCRIEANGIKNIGANRNFTSGAGVYMTGGELIRSLVRNNAAESAAAGLYVKDSAVVSNCTFVGNVSYRDENGRLGNGAEIHGQSAIVTGNDKPRLSRCIVWGNGERFSPYPQVNVHAGTLTNSLVEADPLFVDAANGDYRLRIGSPAIALGAGCEPYVADHAALRCGFGVATNDVPAGGGAVLTAMVEGAGDDAVSYAWYLDDAATPFATTPVATLGGLTAGRRKVRLVVEAGGARAESENAAAIDVHPHVAYVSTTGAGIYPYDTPEKATNALAEAFAALWRGPNATGDLHVAAGRYAVDGGVVITEALRIHGAGRDETVLDGRNSTMHRVFSLSHDGALVEDLTVSNNCYFCYSAAGSGGGARMTAGTIRRCRFVKCDLKTAYQHAGAVWMSDGTLADSDLVDSNLEWSFAAKGSCLYQQGGLVTNCTMRGCTRASNGGGAPGNAAYVAGGVMDGCRIVGNGHENRSSQEGSGLYQTGGTVRNTLICANTNRSATAGACVQGGVFEFNTVAGNVTTADQDGRSGVTVAGGTVRNCIIFGNGRTGACGVRLTGGACERNLLDKENVGATDCLVAANPFRDAASGDYRLAPGSAAIDAALPTDLKHDHAGQTRPQGAACDLGAYEYVAGEMGFLCSIRIDQTVWPSGASPTASAYVEGAPGAVSYAWYVAGRPDPISTEAELTWEGIPNGRHALRLEVSSGGQTVSCEVPAAFDVRPTETYAGPDGSNEYPYDTPAKAAHVINDAFDALWVDAETPVTLHVLDGTCELNSTLYLTRKVSLVGTGAGKAVIDGKSEDNGSRILQGVVVDHDDARVEGVCITNVCYNLQDPRANGAGVALLAGAVHRCRITGCWTYGAYQSGAGAYVAGGVLSETEIDHCYLKWSYDSYGCGVYQVGGLVTDCWIHHNPTPCMNGGAGVGLRGGLMTGCLITDNGTTGPWNGLDAGDGAGVRVSESGVLRNCVVRGNLNSTKCAGVAVYPLANGSQDANVPGGRVEHCTIFGNDAVASSGGNAGLVQRGGTVVNSIVYGNGANYRSVGSVVLEGGTFATNLMDVANARALDCVVSDPQFADAAAGDLRLRLGSPAIGRGAVLEGCETDMAGARRDASPDLGAYEHDSSGGALACGISIPQAICPAGATASATAVVAGERQTGLSYAWYVNGGETPVSEARDLVLANASPGLYALRLVVANDAGETCAATNAQALDVRPFETYAAPDGAHVYPYDTPARAATNVNEALVALWSQETDRARRVTVAPGRYALTDTLALSFPVSLVGAGSGRTILDASGLAKRALHVTDPSAEASGFEICGLRESVLTPGSAVLLEAGTVRGIAVSDVSSTEKHGIRGLAVAVTGGLFCDSVISNCEARRMHMNTGVGLCLSGGIVRNCTIVGNRRTGSFYAAGVAVGAYVDGGVLEGSRILGNTVEAGCGGTSGLRVVGGTVRSCLIVGNVGGTEPEALLVPPDAADDVSIVNCTIASNVTASCPAVRLEKGRFLNGIAYGNSGTNLAAADRALVRASCWPENASSRDGNLVNADPLFRSPARGDYRLRRGSPCVDAGLWEALGATREEVRGQADAVGARRLTGLSVDMGCCENDQHGLMLLVR